MESYSEEKWAEKSRSTIGYYTMTLEKIDKDITFCDKSIWLA